MWCEDVQANAFLDAFAQSDPLPFPVISVNWNEWQIVGMAADTEMPTEMPESADTGNTDDRLAEMRERAAARGFDPSQFTGRGGRGGARAQRRDVLAALSVRPQQLDAQAVPQPGAL